MNVVSFNSQPFVDEVCIVDKEIFQVILLFQLQPPIHRNNYLSSVNTPRRTSRATRLLRFLVLSSTPMHPAAKHPPRWRHHPFHPFLRILFSLPIPAQAVFMKMFSRIHVPLFLCCLIQLKLSLSSLSLSLSLRQTKIKQTKLKPKSVTVKSVVIFIVFMKHQLY